MALPVHRREFDVFLSHAHRDRSFVLRISDFLQNAGLAVYLDDTNIEGGAVFPQAIQRGIERSRSALLVATSDAVRQGWVERECAIALDESARDRNFRVIPIKVGDAAVGELIRGVSWLSVEKPELTFDLAAGILRALHPATNRPRPATSRDVYISASWRQSDAASAELVLRQLRDQGFRLIGDSQDQQGFGEDRIERIIASCGALVCILPFREGVTEATANDKPYKYFLQEIDIATELGVPTIVIADPRVRRSDGPDDAWLHLPTAADSLPDDVRTALNELWDVWHPPIHPHFVFLALALESAAASAASPERQLLELVTGLPTIVGNEVIHDPVQHGILERVRSAHLVIADISGDDDESFNLDASIEAGMALASGVNLRLIARGRARRPPFMLRTLQMPTYVDDIERLARLHAIARSFRRRIINDEMN